MTTTEKLINHPKIQNIPKAPLASGIKKCFGQSDHKWMTLTKYRCKEGLKHFELVHFQRSTHLNIHCRVQTAYSLPELCKEKAAAPRLSLKII